MNIREIMTADPVFAEPDTTLEEIATMMKEENIGAVPVVEDGEVSGIVTDRDIVLRCIAEGKDAAECTAGDVMSTEVFCIEPATSAAEAARLMSDRQIRRLAVIENGRLIGMVSIGDVAVKTDDDDLSGDTLEGVSKGVKQEGGGNRGAKKSSDQSSGRARAGEQPFEAETQNLKGSQTGADRGGLKAGRQRAAKNEPQSESRQQSQGLKSDSRAKKQGIANRSAKEENDRNDKVIPFRGENEVRNTRVLKPDSKRKRG